jgi:hypothetical protein
VNVRGLAAGIAAGFVFACPAAASAAQLFPSARGPAGAHSELVSTAKVGADTTRYSYRYGPLVAAPGQNLIIQGPVTIERPQGDGYMTRIKPDLVGEDGKPPPVEQVHMHHAVFVDLSHRDTTYPGLPERFFAYAEEKTIATIPAPAGYPIGPGDVWGLNYMLHNETPRTRVVWLTYDIDFVPKASPTGVAMKPARPIDMDVQNGHAYPVFDIYKDTGRDGRFTYPEDAPGVYGNGPKLNEWTADRDMTLVAAAGHLHPGGLWVDMGAERGGRQAHLFRSAAHYFDPNGPVSWDLAMDLTRPDWRVAIRKGDVLKVSTTYDTTRMSTYEDMGIGVLYAIDGANGPDPFAQQVDTTGEPTHGHLPEDGNYGGAPTGLPDPRGLPDGQSVQNGAGIANFVYMPGDLSESGSLANPPVVGKAASLQFTNFDSSASIPHTVTSCRAPCNGSTGISYPLADGPARFDSGQLDYGPPGLTAASQRSSWSTPTDLAPGTYTFFCRVHPFMRGAFRVSGTPAAAGASAKSKGPSIAIVSRSLRMDRRGRVPVRLRCNGKGGACHGTLQLASVRGHRIGALGSARFTVQAGHVRSVRVKFRRAPRRLVLRKRRLPVLARARPAAGGATSSATLVLRAPKRRH